MFHINILAFIPKIHLTKVVQGKEESEDFSNVTTLKAIGLQKES